MACNCSVPNAPTSGFRRALWVALWLNLAMFFVEGLASIQSGSVSLLADAIDFFGDSANYIISLSLLSMGMLWRSRAAMVKGLTMATFGLVVWGRTIWVASNGMAPESLTMGVVGFIALVVNLGVAIILFRFRNGDSDMRSVWLCSRNDAIGNVAVMVAALGVFGTSSAWPDLAVAAIMGTLAITSGISVVRHARRDIAEAAQNTSPNHQPVTTTAPMKSSPE